MIRPVWLLTLLAAFGFSAVFVLPEQDRLLPSAVRMEWPDMSGHWVKVRETEPSPQEIAILARDTEFSKAEFYHSLSRARIDVGIVLSADDVNESIHRPERCLVAQGHSGLKTRRLEFPLDNGLTLPVTRLFTRLERQLPTEDGTPRRIAINCVTYYWFVGHDMLTASHYTRTFKDITDRLFKGSNQRWAYVTVSAFFPDPEEGMEPIALRDQADGPLDRIMSDFVIEIIPQMLKDEQLGVGNGGKN